MSALRHNMSVNRTAYGGRSPSRYASGQPGFTLHRPAGRMYGGSCPGRLAVLAEKHSVVSTLTLHTQLIEAAVPSGVIAGRSAGWAAEAGRARHGLSMKADRYAPSRAGAVNHEKA